MELDSPYNLYPYKYETCHYQNKLPKENQTLIRGFKKDFYNFILRSVN